MNYFENKEFECKCGCGFAIVHPELLNMLNQLRERLGEAIYISSGCRCPGHDIMAGGSGGGFHTRGMAADIYTESMENGITSMDELANICTALGFGGVERNDHFGNYVHVDVRDMAGYARYLWRFDFDNGERECDKFGNVRRYL